MDGILLTAHCKLLNAPRQPGFRVELTKNRIALARAFAQYPSILARVFSAAVNGVEAFLVEVEVNSGWGGYDRRNIC
jgi:hypothetical protein